MSRNFSYFVGCEMDFHFLIIRKTIHFCINTVYFTSVNRFSSFNLWDGGSLLRARNQAQGHVLSRQALQSYISCPHLLLFIFQKYLDFIHLTYVSILLFVYFLITSAFHRSNAYTLNILLVFSPYDRIHCSFKCGLQAIAWLSWSCYTCRLPEPEPLELGSVNKHFLQSLKVVSVLDLFLTVTLPHLCCFSNTNLLPHNSVGKRSAVSPQGHVLMALE